MRKEQRKWLLWLVMASLLLTVLTGCWAAKKPQDIATDDETTSQSTASEVDEEKTKEKEYPKADKQQHVLELGEDALEKIIQIDGMEIYPAFSEYNSGNQNLLVVYYTVANYGDEDINPYQEWLSHVKVTCYDKQTGQSYELSNNNANLGDAASRTERTLGTGQYIPSQKYGEYVVPFYFEDSSEIPYNAEIKITFEVKGKSMDKLFDGGEFAVADLIVE